MLILHDYWRSSAAYRVRIALALKGIEYKSVAHNLLKNEQASEAYRRINPLGLVPALETGDRLITQSTAIIEWLDEQYPEYPLLPEQITERAQVRAIAQTVACDIHPLNNLRVLKALGLVGSGQSNLQTEWISRWVEPGFAAIEHMLMSTAGEFAYGDTPGFADCFLVPQVYSAQRYNIPIASYPTLARVVHNASRHDIFQSAHPDSQIKPEA